MRSRALFVLAAVFVTYSGHSTATTSRLHDSQVTLDKALSGGPSTLTWKWQERANATYRIAYELDGITKTAPTTARKSTALGSDSTIGELTWTVPFYAQNVRLEERIGDKLVAQSQPVSPRTTAQDIAADVHAAHDMNHMVHAAMMSPAPKSISKALSIPSVGDFKPMALCPAGANDEPLGSRPPGDSCAPKSVGDPINLADGSFWMQVPCFILGGAGRPIVFNVHYDSHKWADKLGYSGFGTPAAAINGTRGSGWIGSYQRRLVRRDDDIYLITEDGSWTRWTGANSGSFVPVTGNFSSSMTRNGAGEYTIVYRNGEKDIYYANLLLKRVEDRAGNASDIGEFAVSGDGKGRYSITNSVTKQGLMFEHSQSDNEWLLTRVSEFGPGLFNPRQMLFSYGTAGNNTGKLTRITDVAGRLYHFDYDADGRIEKFWDPLNNPANPQSIPTVNEYALAGWSGVDHGNYDKLAVRRQTRGNRRLDINLTYVGQFFGLASDTSSDYLYRRDVAYQALSNGSFETFRRQTHVIGLLASAGQHIVFRSFAPTVNTVVSTADATNANPALPYVAYRYNSTGTVAQVLSNLPTRRVEYEYDSFNQLAVETVRNGAAIPSVTRYTRNTFAQVVKIEEPAGGSTRFEYDPVRGWLFRVIRASAINGQLSEQFTSFRYGAIPGFLANPGLPTAIDLPDLTRNTQSYDNLGYPRTLTLDANGIQLTETTVYDGRGFLTSYTDTRGVVTNYGYQSDPANGFYGNLGEATDITFDANARAVRTALTRDAMLNVTKSVVDAGVGRLNATTLTTYASVGHDGDYAPVEVTNAEGRTVAMAYNGLGELEKIIQRGARTGAATNLVNCAGGSEARANSLDRLTRFCYTPEGFAQKTILDDGTIAVGMDYQGNGDGVPRSVVDARGVRVDYVYDGKGRLAQQIDGASALDSGTKPAINAITSYSYDLNDRLVGMFKNLPGGTRTVYSALYDGFGRMVWQKDGAGNQTDNQYNDRNFLLSTTFGANGQFLRTEYTYDALGRMLTQVVDPYTKRLTTSYKYSASGSTDRALMQEMTNPRGMVTQYRYNSFGAIAATIDALGAQHSYSHNNLSYMTRLQPPTGAPTDYTVNKLGETTALQRNGQIETWVYNSDATPKVYQDFSGQQVNFSYDARGRVTRKDYSGLPNDPQGNRSDVDYSYLPNDLLQSVTSKPNGSTSEATSYAYDAANRLISRSRGGRSVGYSYNQDHTLAQLDNFGRSQVGYNYGAAAANNGLVRALSIAGASSAYSYRSTNLLSTISRPSANGISTSFRYDTASRLTAMESGKSASDIQYSAQYELDANGNRTRLQDTFGIGGGLIAPTFAVSKMAYDPLDRLIHADYSGRYAREENYSYDTVGNRTNTQITNKFNSGDMNRDGTPDFIWRNQDNTAGQTGAWIMGGSTNNQILRAAYTDVPVPSNLWSTLPGDLNGDGKSELIWRNTGTTAMAGNDAGANVYWRMQGADGMSFAAGSNLLNTAGIPIPVTDLNWTLEAAADINRDGKADLLWRNKASEQFAVWYMGAGVDGQQMIGTGTFQNVSTNYRLGAAADFNNDGFVDFAWQDVNAGNVAIWLMGGDGTKITKGSLVTSNGAVVSAVTGASKWDLRGAQDINKDGTPDMIWHKTDTGEQAVWYMGADATIQQGTTPFTTISAAAPWEISKASYYNRVVSETPLAYDASDRINSPAYPTDANGNLQALPGSRYSYTAANKLLTSTTNFVTTEYQYDGLGNLVRQIRAGVTTDYVLDELAANPKVIGEISGASETIFVHGPEGLHAQQRFVSGVAQPIDYALIDGLGSLKVLTSGTGQVVKSMAYDAWGQQRNSSNSSATSLGFTGEQQFSDGTVNLRARTYLPSLGRFLQRDSFAGFSARPQSLNRYAYVEGNPGNWTDPSGYASFWHGVGNMTLGALGVAGGVSAVSASGIGGVASGGTLTPVVAVTGTLAVGWTISSGAQYHSGLQEVIAAVHHDSEATEHWGAVGDTAATISGVLGIGSGAMQKITAGAATRAISRRADVHRQFGEGLLGIDDSVNAAHHFKKADDIRKSAISVPTGREIGEEALVALGQTGGGMGGSDIPDRHNWPDPTKGDPTKARNADRGRLTPLKPYKLDPGRPWKDYWDNIDFGPRRTPTYEPGPLSWCEITGTCSYHFLPGPGSCGK
jgi:RHS repeat-associated protein